MAKRNPRLVAVLVVGGLIIAVASAAAAIVVTGGRQRDARATTVGGIEVTAPSSSTTTAVPATIATMVEEVRTGIARITATTCGGDGGTGTGFLVDPTHVLTVAHVVDDAASIAVTFDDDDTVRVATVVGFDAVKEVALLQLDRAVDGHVFDLAFEPVRVGDEIAALGYPLGLKLTFTRGVVSGLDRTIEWDDRTLTGLLQTDAPLNPGNSGGPLLTMDGRVRGLHEAGIDGSDGLSFAVAAEDAIPLLKRWRTAPDVRQPADCERPLHPDGDVEVEVLDDEPESLEIAQTLTRYFRAINDGLYDEAWAQYSEAAKARVPRDRFAAGVRSSYDFDITLHETTITSGVARSHVTFTSLQNAELGPRPGERCTEWSLDYVLVRAGGRWTIDKTTSHGTDRSAACSEDDDGAAT